MFCISSSSNIYTRLYAPEVTCDTNDLVVTHQYTCSFSLRDRTQVEQLLHYIVEEPPEDAESKRTFKYVITI